ncbi:MAG: hypothetical protein AB7S38_37390 [Vulcanimicrobiota bacterium]
MAKECPDLLLMSVERLTEFWQQNDPESLRRVGDRLLAESLPGREPRQGLAVEPGWLTQTRETRGVELAAMADRLGVTPHLLASWEQGAVRPPESLGLIYKKL